MAQYSSQTVAQLKELLKQKGLSTSGVKSELITRLEGSDASAAPKTAEAPAATEAATEAAEATEESVPAAAAAAAAANTSGPAQELAKQAESGGAQGDLKVIPPSEDKNEQAGEPAEEKKEEAKEDAKEEEKEEEKPKELSPEERKAAAIELLEKKIARAKKFGDDEAQKAAEKDLVRVRKFGVDPGTALAREIGLTTGIVSLNSGYGKVSKNRHSNRGGRHRKGRGRRN